MADEHEFIQDGLQRSQIDEFFAEELGRAGYGGMEMAPTPMGMQIVLKAEKPGMVIGKGGKNIRKVTTQLEERFNLEDPQIDVQEVDEPDLNARIVADRLANALERGWYFRKAGHTTLERIMDAGALGAEIVLSGKVTGARSRVEKFNDGYIKHNGEPAETVVDHGQGVAVMKLGTIGVDVKIIPPGAELPDDFAVHADMDVDEVAPEAVEANEAADLIEEPDDDELAAIQEEAQGDADEASADADEEAADEDVESVDEEVVEEVLEEDVEDVVDEDVDVPTDDDVEEDFEELDEAVEAEAEEMLEEMDDEDEDTEE
ncbi:30S ribosomal protein S3 [Halorubellus sp. JP-L1]|uniref:30S ribosomal protein S3 n=1 Tax=Halorubellus sp. JP-L1 TaxID=2715753 RepID=UPI0014094EB8|nr:30S ribosomal protein S3 [Halorubellus sp. JP-L1]NHN41262.1 30S ribosomal protein S3 [Halorubellus sp. JP-L1]